MALYDALQLLTAFRFIVDFFERKRHNHQPLIPIARMQIHVGISLSWSTPGSPKLHHQNLTLESGVVLGDGLSRQILGHKREPQALNPRFSTPNRPTYK